MRYKNDMPANFAMLLIYSIFLCVILTARRYLMEGMGMTFVEFIPNLITGVATSTITALVVWFAALKKLPDKVFGKINAAFALQASNHNALMQGHEGLAKEHSTLLSRQEAEAKSFDEAKNGVRKLVDAENRREWLREGAAPAQLSDAALLADKIVALSERAQFLIDANIAQQAQINELRDNNRRLQESLDAGRVEYREQVDKLNIEKAQQRKQIKNLEARYSALQKESQHKNDNLLRRAPEKENLDL